MNETPELKCPKCGSKMNYYASMLTARCEKGCGLLDGVHWRRNDAVKALQNGAGIR